jgi:hypothetical protein
MSLMDMPLRRRSVQCLQRPSVASGVASAAWPQPWMAQSTRGRRARPGARRRFGCVRAGFDEPQPIARSGDALAYVR